MTELPPLNPDPPKSWASQIGSVIQALEGLAKQISGLVVLITAMLVAGTTLMVAIHGNTQNKILQDVNSAKDVQAKAVAVEVRGNPQDVAALKETVEATTQKSN